MIRNTVRAGAFASAALLFAVLLGTGTTGAVAQDQAPAAAIDAAPAAEATADSGTQPRFVSHAVVQELPAESGLASATAEAASLTDLVASLPASTDLSPEMNCLAEAVYFESRGEPLDGQLAVAEVVINRAASDLFPDDYCSVVTQRAQFSFVHGGNIPAPNTSSIAWQRAKAIARIAHQDLWDSEAGDALYFHAAYVKPRWASQKIARARIDSHIFYR